MIKILLVEDDKYLGGALKRYLEINKFICDWLEDDRDVMSNLNYKIYDLIILDLILKFSKGEDLLKRIRNKLKTPVIILTAKNQIQDKETCFDLGADDYITKPFNPKELILRINSLLRRTKPNNLVINDIQVDLNKKIAKKNGKVVGFTKKEWFLLEFLIKNKGRVVSCEEILNYVWGDEDVGEDSIRTYIRRLRSVLGKDAIKNIKGRGYLLLD